MAADEQIAAPVSVPAALPVLGALDIGAAMAVVLIWALNFIVGKVGVSELPPLLFLTLRFGLVAVLLVPWLRVPRGQWRGVLLLSVLLGGLHFGCTFAGLAGIAAGSVAIAIQLGVPFSALLAYLFYRERLGRWQLAGMTLAFGGIYLLAGEPQAAPSLGHLALVALGAFAWALANIVIKRIGPISPMRLNAWVALLAAPQLLLGSLLLERDHVTALANADVAALAAVAYTAIGASITAYGLWYYLIGKYEVNRVVPYTFLSPVIAVGLAALLLDEPLTWPLVAGGVVTTLGVAMIQRLKPPRRGGAF